ncbi:hypothetical protein GCM10023172_23040 [Hymenobacter ginsengisoli]|uniref:Uncharacterized protein n=2 Tax=Hymenobacteraceae TaxID=1853232 RepID=A0ABP8QDT9_9BACT
MAPDWMLKALRHQVLNSPAEWQLSSKVCKLVDRGGLTMAEALLMLQHIQQEIETTDVEERQRLCRAMVETIKEYPELFTQKWYGQQYVSDVVATIEHHGDSWRHLRLAHERLQTVAEVWKHTKHLVEYAIVDGVKLASDIRKAARGTHHTHEMDCARMQALACKLFGPASDNLSNFGARQALEKIFELVTDSSQAVDLVRIMQQVLTAHE